KQEVPKDLNEALQLGTEFATDIGINVFEDVDRRSTKVAESVRLRKEIAELRREIILVLKELQRRSEKYAHVAESAGHWVVDAKRFVDKHPNLLWFLKEHKKTGTK
ncbi:MAG: hypothetical protein ACRD3W_16520, partial [Terriglobales bacterium]